MTLAHELLASSQLAMDFELQPQPPAAPEMPEFAEPPIHEPLELQLPDPDEVLSLTAVEGLELAVKPVPVSVTLERNSTAAKAFLSELAKIDRKSISDQELQPARLQIGLTFVGFSALAMVLLLLHISSLHPEYSLVERIEAYWYQYIWFVCMGVAGMMILGRESLRQPVSERHDSDNPKPE